MFSIVSCSKDDGGKNNPTVTQTVFVFFPWAENLTTTSSFLPEDLKEIKSAIKEAGNMNGYRVIVYRGNSESTAELFELKLNKGEVVENKLKDYSDIDQTSINDLTAVFSYVSSPADPSVLPSLYSYKMIIGGHGCGWLPSDLTYRNLSKFSVNSFGGSSKQSIRINLSTLANALNNAGMTPDMIIFDACLMGNIETLWDLRNSAEYIVAPPSEEPGYGFPYDMIWSDIIAETSLDNMKSLCDKYKQYFENDHSGYETLMGTSCSPANMSVIDCQGLQSVADAMKAINADTLASKNINNILGGTASLSSVQRYDMKTSGIYYDIESYAHTILQPESYPHGAILYSNLKTALQTAVKYFVNSGYFLSKGKYCYPLINEDICGLAISDPSINTYVTPYKEQTEWWKATH